MTTRAGVSSRAPLNLIDRDNPGVPSRNPRLQLDVGVYIVVVVVQQKDAAAAAIQPQKAPSTSYSGRECIRNTTSTTHCLPCSRQCWTQIPFASVHIELVPFIVENLVDPLQD